MVDERSLSTWIVTKTLVRYIIAILSVVGALAAGRLLAPLSDYLPFVAVFYAVAFSAWYCGLVPSALAVAGGLIGLKYWFLPPVHALRTLSRNETLGLILLAVAFVAIMAMGESRRRQNQRLRRAQGDLEGRVSQRTAELDAANRELRELTARLMQLQDEERRRIARELHDSVGQTLAALSMNLTAVGTDIERLVNTARTISDSAALVQEMNKEVRTISYLLHPPLLDETGLAPALKWYINGFSQRSCIEVALEIAEDFGRLPQDAEMAIFRTVQECLTNIHRHSNSPTAKIRLRHFANELSLEVSDQGRGIGPEKLAQVLTAGAPGVGIRGMRERLHQLGGGLEITSNGNGTVVTVRLPVANSSQTAA